MLIDRWADHREGCAMARKLRLEYPGAIYHVMNRGDRRQAIFKDDTDRELFLATLTEDCDKTGWQVHAYCLMDNHFHLVLEMPDANLVAGMKWFLGTYTSRFNRRHKEFGHLFSGCYKIQCQSLWGNCPGSGSGAGRVDRNCRSGTAEMAGDRTGCTAQRQPGQGKAGVGIVCSNHHAVALDCSSVVHGHAWPSKMAPISGSPEEVSNGYP